jgi:hypothetical protein
MQPGFWYGLAMNLGSIGAGIASTAANAGKGALAGAIATAAMTPVEMKLRGREPSTVPSAAAGKVLGVQPRNSDVAARFSQMVHWSYGTAWGGVGGVLRTLIPEPAATAAHFATVWGTEVTMLPGLEVAPPLPEWEAKEIAIDVFHHLVYAAAFAGAWYLMEKSATDRSLMERIRDQLT